MARHAEHAGLEEWQALFDAHDRDRSGSISTTELGLLLRSAGEFLTDAHITDLIEQTDLDGSGVVDFEEFVGLMRRWQREDWADDQIERYRAWLRRESEGGAGASEAAAAADTSGDDDEEGSEPLAPTPMLELLDALRRGADDAWHRAARGGARNRAHDLRLESERLVAFCDMLWSASSVHTLGLRGCAGLTHAHLGAISRVLGHSSHVSIHFIDLSDNVQIGDAGVRVRAMPRLPSPHVVHHERPCP